MVKIQSDTLIVSQSETKTNNLGSVEFFNTNDDRECEIGSLFSIKIHPKTNLLSYISQNRKTQSNKNFNTKLP